MAITHGLMEYTSSSSMLIDDLDHREALRLKAELKVSSLSVSSTSSIYNTSSYFLEAI